MSCSKSTCCVPQKGERGLKGSQGIQGDVGAQGAQGETGAQGVPGVDSPTALSYSSFQSGILDFSWPSVITPITGVSFMASDTANYQAHFNILTNYNAVNPVTIVIALYVNGLLVTQKNIFSSVDDPGRFTREVSFLWRGGLTATDVIDIRCMTASGVTATSTYFEMLINKEG